MSTRTESTIFMEQIVEMDEALKFMRQWNTRKEEDDWPITPMQLFLCALVRTVAQRPRMNRFISNRRHYQRNNISVSFVTKKTLSDDGLEVNVIMPFHPHDTLKDVNERFKRFIGTAKSDEGNRCESDVDIIDKLPHWAIRAFIRFFNWADQHNFITRGMIRMLPFYSTMFVTNVGSIGLEAPLHHNYEMGNTGIFAALGIIRKEKVILEDNSITEKSRMAISYTFDDRIVDGIYSGRAMAMLKDYLENPEKLMERPDIDPAKLDELALTEKGWDLWDKN